MSRNREILDVIRELIFLLDEQKVIAIPDLLDRIGYVERKTAFVEFSKNINYKQVARFLNDVGTVFLRDISRKRAWYACQKLKDITGKKIEYVRAHIDDREGYLFSLVQEIS